MAARLIHVGKDVRFRVPVLVKLGYSVDICESIDSFSACLVKSPLADAVAITDGFPELSLKCATLVRATTAIPLICFEGATPHFSSKGGPESSNDLRFELTIPPLTPPRDWLSKVDNFFAETRALHARLKATREASELLRVESALIRLEAEAERKASQDRRAKAWKRKDQ